MEMYNCNTDISTHSNVHHYVSDITSCNKICDCDTVFPLTMY